MIHPLMAIYRYMHQIATNEYHKNKHHICVKRLFLYFTLNNFKSLQFLVSISIEFHLHPYVQHTFPYVLFLHNEHINFHVVLLNRHWKYE